jgi:ribosomal protein S18 acetylase RimI-like enzyme
MEDIHIRKATPDDLKTLLQFEQGMIEAERPFDPTLKPNGIHYYNLKALLTSDQVELVVAETKNEIVGCGYARIEKAKPYLQHEYYAYLGFMYVLPEHRGKGINQRIISTLKDWAFLKGVTELRLEVYTNNASAIKAYEKTGFQPLMLLMRMDDRSESSL